MCRTITGEFWMKDLRWGGRTSAVVVGMVMAGMFARSARGQQQITITQSQTQPPRGWLGISLQQDTAADGKMRYPILVAVDPGSPAQKAGLTAGDTIIEYEKIDARTPWRPGIRPYMVPNRKIALRYRRNGLKETTVVVGKRQSVMEAHIEFSLSADSGQGTRIVTSDSGMSIILQMLAPLAIFGPMRVGGDVSVAGASVTRMNEGLASTLGVANSGLFVIDVTPDTPAERAGLQSGDIITTVNKTVCSDPAVIVKAVLENLGKKKQDVKLGVQRKGKPVLMVLR